MPQHQRGAQARKGHAPPADLQAAQVRLVKLCGMLGSEHDGERAAAAMKADQLLREHGLRWSDAIRLTPHKPTHAPEPDDDVGDWRAVCRACQRHAARLSDWELGFLRSLETFAEPSAKQLSCLDRIARKVGVNTV